MDRRGFLLASCATLALAGRGHADDLDDQVARLASEGHVCAVSATMLRNGHEARALSASGCGANPGSDAVFQAASLSKPVVAYVVLRLARRGELSLDHPLSEIFPDGYQHRQNLFALKAAPIVDTVAVDVLRTVTPRLLLSHGAGFPNWASDGPLTQTSAPGTCWQYSGEGYVLLQRMLETLTGRPLQQLAEQELFAPIGLTNTAFKLTPAIQTQLVAGSPRQLRFPYEIAASSSTPRRTTMPASWPRSSTTNNCSRRSRAIRGNFPHHIFPGGLVGDSRKRTIRSRFGTGAAIPDFARSPWPTFSHAMRSSC